MAITTGTTTSYAVGSAGGNREDLEDTIWDLFAEETWALTNLDHVESTGTFHEWITDILPGATANRAIEGNAATYATTVAPTRLGNYNQISDKTFLISRTQEKVAKAGRRSEIERQSMKQMLALKNDMELALVTNQASDAGSSGTARSSAGMESWIATNEILATTTSSATTVGYSGGVVAAPTDGATTGALTEAAFKSALQNAWIQGGRPRVVLTGAAQKNVIDSFAGIASPRLQLNSGQQNVGIIATIDAYASAYGNQLIVLHRFVRSSVVLLIDPDLWAVSFFDPPFVERYAKSQDGEAIHMASEFCLVSRNEAGSAKVVSCS